MILRHLRAAVGGVSELTAETINDVKSSLQDSLGESATLGRRLLLDPQTGLASSASELESLAKDEAELSTAIKAYHSSLSSLLARAKQLASSRSEFMQGIKTERTKLTVYQKLRRFSCLHCDIKQFLAGDSFGEARAAFDELQELSRPLKLMAQFDKVRGDYRDLLQRRFPEVLAISDRGFSLRKVPDMAPLLVVLNLVAAFCDVFFSYLIDRFLPLLFGNRVGLVIDNLTYTLGDGGPTGISACLPLFQSLLSVFRLAGVEFSRANQERYATIALQLASQPILNVSQDLETVINELCDLAGMERRDVAVLIRESILARVLGDSRQMLREGRPFLEVVAAARGRVDKGEFPRALRQLAILATVVWKDDKDKLRSVIPMLFALEPAGVAFECGLFMERAIRAE
jgi:hypothetical protein